MVTAVILYLYIAAALFLTQPAYAAGALAATAAIAILIAYAVDRSRGLSRLASLGLAAPTHASVRRLGCVPAQRTAPERADAERRAA